MFIVNAVVLTMLLAFAQAEGSERLWGLRTYGSLGAIRHHHQIGRVAEINQILPDDTLYGVGELSGLRGEITIVAGVPYASYPLDPDLSETESPPHTEEAVCLLVTAQVSRWIDAAARREIPFEDLDRVVADLARSVGVDTDEAFPFLIESTVEDLRWHVIDGSRLPVGGGGQLAHVSSAVRHRREVTPATLIGFYSPRDHGVFTQMEVNTHLHSVVENPLSAGHVDHVVIPAGTIVHFPALEKPEPELEGEEPCPIHDTL